MLLIYYVKILIMSRTLTGMILICHLILQKMWGKLKNFINSQSNLVSDCARMKIVSLRSGAF